MPNFSYDPEKDIIKVWSNTAYLYDYFETHEYFFSKEMLTRYFLSLKTKPFVILTGISGTGKTKIAQVFAHYMCQEEETKEERQTRYAFVPVRPDWMDNKGLLGYFNLLDEKYHSTPVLRILLEAEKHPDKPYFVILDEMNLAKVEQYFSDFLSIMESRTTGDPQGEKLNLHAVKEAKTPDGFSIPQNIHIPPNVFFTGTVNVDESTYMFSPKVLDRANVIDFNEVDLKNYGKGFSTSDRFVLKDADILKKLLPIPNSSFFCSKADFSELTKKYPKFGDYLSEVQDILYPSNLHFGYRVINEISAFIRYAFEMVDGLILEEAIDIQILQKILPKFHGTQAKLEGPLEKFLVFCRGENKLIEESYLEIAASFDKEARFPRSAQKLARMILNLKIQGYASFIE
ncbi:MAG: AAA family ATPase [Thermodesulfobacteriota bacterium]